MKYRIEKDSLGKVNVPEKALYGAQTQRAIENFPVSGIPLPAKFIRATGFIKAAAASSNALLGTLDKAIAREIKKAALDIAKGKYHQHFPVDVFQTGSGTSTNMNVNEVIATLASRKLGFDINPNDHVNLAQSSNDVIPSAIHISAVLELTEHLIPALQHLEKTIDNKAKSVENIVKTGRTHLMDGMPLTLAQELSGWSAQVRNCAKRLTQCLPELCQIAQGGTAVGTGVNTPADFAHTFASELSGLLGIQFQPNPCFFEALSCQDSIVALSGQLKVTAVALTKIANDLRWMNSGPLAGLSEIELQPLQPGSSIMPGKVNPVIPESVTMIAAQVIGNDATITIAGQSGNFQLNVMLPVIAYNLLQSIQLLANGTLLLADKAINTFKVQEDNINRHLNQNPILATALNPVIGYNKAAEIAKQAYQQKRPILDVALERTKLSRKQLKKLLNPARLTSPEKQS